LSRRGFLSGLGALTLFGASTDSSLAANSGYTKGDPLLKTRWFDDVGPNNSHTEYPRPQMERTEWKNLNGIWGWEETTEGSSPPTGQTLANDILVPFPPESALSGIQIEPGSEWWMWYRHVFDVPSGWDGRTVLHIERADWKATVYVNGTEVGTHKGGYDSFSFDITPHLTGSDDELLVKVYDPTTSGTQPTGKQRLNSGEPNDDDIFMTPASGIWESVWLEPVPQNHISELDIQPLPNVNSVGLSVGSSNPSGWTIEARALDDGTQVRSVTGPSNDSLLLRIDNPTLWTPANPKLYDLEIDLKDGNGNVVDSVSSYFGLRSVGTKLVNGTLRPTLNGEFVFHNGIYDHGYWPDGIYTPPTDAAMKFDLEKANQLGYNTYRKHIKVESKRWFYWADKLGLLVWNDVPCQHLFSASANEADREQFEAEMRRMIREHDNHPSLVGWMPVNEGWGFGKDNTDRMRTTAAIVENMSSEDRLVDAVSGVNTLGGNEDDLTNGPGNGDTIDFHTYGDEYGDTSEIPGSSGDRFGIVGESSNGWTPAVVQDVGLVVCGADNRITADFANVRFSWSVAPDRYTQVDTTTSGDASFNESDLTISAAGDGIWKGVDEYGALAIEEVVGDFQCAVTVESKDTGSQYSKAGLMAANEASNAGGSVGDFHCHLVEDADGNHVPEVTWDSDANGYVDTVTKAGTTVSLPVDLRIRSINGDNTTLVGEFSTDGGTSWTEIDRASPQGAGSTRHQWGDASGGTPRNLVSNIRNRAQTNENYMTGQNYSGAINLQTTDVEDAFQGVTTYDRDIFKPARIKNGVTDVKNANQNLIDASKNLGSESLAVENAYWPMDSGSGSTTTDLVGNADLSLSGPSWVTGEFGTALHFDGSNDEADAGQSLVDTDGNFTVSAWVKLDNLTNDFRTAVSQEDGDAPAFWLQYNGNNNRWRFALKGSTDPAEGGPAVRAGRWYHIVGRVNIRTNETSLFVDGEKVATITGTGQASSGNTIVGRARFNGNKSSWFLGTIDQVRTVDGALQDDHVAQIHDAEQIRPEISYEAGVATNGGSGDNDYSSVSLSSSYGDPVVVTGPATHNGDEPLPVRVRNVSTSSFEYALDEWEYVSHQGHVDEDVSYGVFEAGTGYIGGAPAEADHVSGVDGTFKTVSFDANFSTTPAVVTTPVTAHGPDAINTRIRNVSVSGFEVRVQEQESNTDGHTTEQVDFVAIEPTDADGVEVGRTGDAVGDAVTTISYDGFPVPPAFLASTNTVNGPEPGALRISSQSASGTDLFFEEEQSADTETGHLAETVSWIALSNGSLH
jgi:hypothetical protein